MLLSAARLATFEHPRGLTKASGFFFGRDKRLTFVLCPLSLVTSRQVLLDEPTPHHPNRIEIELHTATADRCGGSGQFGADLSTSGAALVMRVHHADADVELPWTLLGMESAR